MFRIFEMIIYQMANYFNYRKVTVYLFNSKMHVRKKSRVWNKKIYLVHDYEDNYQSTVI